MTTTKNNEEDGLERVELFKQPGFGAFYIVKESKVLFGS